MGLVSGLSRGLIGFEQGKRLRQDDEAAAIAAQKKALHDALAEDLMRKNFARPDPIDPLSAAGIAAHNARERGTARARAGRGGAGGVDERAVIGLANRLFDPEQSGEGSGGYATWDDAYSEALKRYQTVGRLGGRQPPPAAAPKSTHIDVPPLVRKYVAGQNRGPAQGASPTAPNPQQAEYDALVKQFGADSVRQRLGPRPS